MELALECSEAYYFHFSNILFFDPYHGPRYDLDRLRSVERGVVVDPVADPEIHRKPVVNREERKRIILRAAGIENLPDRAPEQIDPHRPAFPACCRAKAPFRTPVDLQPVR